MTKGDQMKSDPHSIPDPSRSVDLGNGYRAAMCINEDGSVYPWLVAAANSDPHGCACQECAPHEQNTRIPHPMRRALHLTCGRPRADGQPCRASVRTPGMPCHQHVDRERIA